MFELILASLCIKASFLSSNVVIISWVIVDYMTKIFTFRSIWDILNCYDRDHVTRSALAMEHVCLARGNFRETTSESVNTFNGKTVWCYHSGT